MKFKRIEYLDPKPGEAYLMIGPLGDLEVLEYCSIRSNTPPCWRHSDNLKPANAPEVAALIEGIQKGLELFS